MILTIGCSWTFGTGVESNETFSAYLQDKCGTTVINGGHAGIDNAYAVYSAYRLYQKYKPKVILFQLTTFDRMQISISGKKNFLDKRFHDNLEQPVWTREGKHTRLWGITEEKTHKITVGEYSNSLSKKSDIDTTTKFLYENHTFSTLATEQLMCQLDMLKSYIENFGDKIIFFPWVPTPVDVEKVLPVPVHQESVHNFLDNSHYIDNGYHISPQGHKLVADEYIYPMVRSAIE
ncbi:MAG: hypothetical protein CMC73_02905 [Flavobacteriaceae bacterium]|nr:hypothetical protein [Flavobacteriaceae bacterium]|tara:strand:+ start:746 stop:1447 length:702 start_codon:yes stop_codon:yes gene_type:complete